jgi:cytochrome b6-f complex iron-sulfur subunit
MSELNRREFNLLILAGAAGSLVPGCSSPYDGSVSLTNGQAVLSFTQFPELASVGGAAVVAVQQSFPIVVVRTTQTEVVALSATCTHQGCIMSFETSRQEVHCPCHNADFDLSGAIRRGPPRVPIPTYQAMVGSDAVVVQITG